MKYGIRNYSKILLQLGLFLSLLLVDQFSKYFIRHFGGFYICNTGIAFGLKFSTIIIFLFWLIIFIFIWKLSKIYKSNKTTRDGMILMISGGISNLIDRLIFGCIMDFIDLHFWPVFNLADIFICLGAIMIIVKNINPKVQN